jgi:hypothetical protein
MFNILSVSADEISWPEASILIAFMIFAGFALWCASKNND